jgi:hypothetical protein
VLDNNTGLRKASVAERENVTREWRRLYNEALLNIIRIIPLSSMRWAGYVTSIEEERNSYKVLVEA